MLTSRFNSILELDTICECLEASEKGCDLLFMEVMPMDNEDKKIDFLQNKFFKNIIFTLMIFTTILINSGYIQSRESSKVDYLFNYYA